MARKQRVETVGHSSLRLHLESTYDGSNENSRGGNDLDESIQTLVDTVERFKPIQAEFLEVVQNKQQEDDSLSQLSYCVNDSAIDKRFDDVYEKGGILGEGGFAFVYQCRHVENRHTYAVKECMKAESDHNGNPDEIKAEIKALRLVKESSLFVRLLDVFDLADRTYLVMEEMKGGDLLDKLGEVEVYEEWEARKLMRTLLEAVAYCHKRKICHRDIKPENILLPRANDITLIKLADFGCAKRWKKSNEMETLCGSPQYVAPEVVGERPSGGGYGCQCDLWSCGVVLYIILGGYAPFESDDELELVDMICDGEYEFHEEYWGEIEIAPQDLISQLLEVNPRKRLTARQSLSSPWLRRRDRDWVSEMDDSQSTLGAWLEKRSSIQSGSRFSASSSPYSSLHTSRHPSVTALSASSGEIGSVGGTDNQGSTSSLLKWWDEETTQDEVTSFSNEALLAGPLQDSSLTTASTGLNLSSE